VWVGRAARKMAVLHLLLDAGYDRNADPRLIANTAWVWSGVFHVGWRVKMTAAALINCSVSLQLWAETVENGSDPWF